MPKKLTKEQFVAKSKLVHGNQYDYSKVNYVRNNVKVCITCPIHGDFWQFPDHHISGQGCPQCGIENRTNKQKLHYEDFIKKAREKHGDKYDYSFVNYKTIKSKVAIICPTHGLFYQIAQKHLYGQGCPKCSRLNSKSNVYGIGINDINESIRHKSIQEYPYKIWSGIIRRCQKSNENFHPSYIGCTVSNEWLYYSNFLDWFNTHYVEGWHIDKDLLKKGNKIYGSETCCFVPQEINNLFRRKRNGRNLPTGVTFVNGRYKSSCFFEGKRIHLGYYDTIEDAFNSYKRKKEEIIKYYADKWKDKLEESVYNAMLNYKVEIDD